MGALPDGTSTRGRREPNGSIETPTDRRGRRKSTKSRSSLSASLFNLSAKLAVWYAIITSLFFCPQHASKLDAESPAVCKPYLQARTYLEPHVRPYYDTHVEPYVQKAKPYFQQVHSKVYTPVSMVSKKYYNSYAAQHVDKAYKWMDDEWEHTAIPYLKNTQKQAQAAYDRNLGPYAKTASDNISPHYDQADKTVRNIYNERIVPTYNIALPYVQQAYDHGHHVIATSILPNVLYAAHRTKLLLSREVWPTLRVLYGENVEPQLMRITERLGRYKDGKKLEAAVDAITSSSSPAGTLAPSVASSLAASMAETPYPSSSTPSPSSTAIDTRSDEEKAREKVAEDLKVWQEKFAKAADKGAEDLGERVKEITDRQIEHQAKGVGESRRVRLEESVSSGIKSLKKTIQSTIEKLGEDATEKDTSAAYDGIVKEIRAAGTAIREEAQAMRTWKTKYDAETKSLVKAASDSTLEVIDNIRDLGLQEIGMRWAWMEGVTYKDWSKYHALKKTFDEWRAEVQGVALDHEGVATAKAEGDAIEEQGMAIAEDAAKELQRLKDVAKWKLHAHDSSDDFSSKNLPAAAANFGKAAQQVVEKVLAAASPSPSAAGFESASSVLSSQISQASEKAQGYASEASMAYLSSSKGTIEDIVSKASSAAHGFAEPATERAAFAVESNISSASEAVAEFASSVGSGAASVASAASASVEDGASAARSAFSEASSGVSIVAIGSEPGVVEQATSSASSALSHASEAVFGSQNVQDSISSSASSVSSKVAEAVIGSSDVTDILSSVANSVSSEASEAIVGTSAATDTVASSASSVSSIASEAIIGSEDASGQVFSVASRASSEVSEAEVGTQTATDKASSAANSASSKASEAVIGSQVTTDNLSSVASSRTKSFSEASGSILSAPKLKADQIPLKPQGTPAPVSEQASSSLSSAASAASEAVAEGASPVSSKLKKVSGGVAAGFVAAAEGPILDHPLDDDQSKIRDTFKGFADQASLEFGRLQSVLAQAVKPSTSTQGTVESLTSVASAQWSAAMSAAVDQLYGHQHTGGVEDRYSQAVSAASSVIYGTPPPLTASLASQASAHFAQATSAAFDQYESARSQLSKPAAGTDKPVYEEMFSSIESAYSGSLKAASKIYEEGRGVVFPTQGVLESVSSQASVALQNALSDANKQYTAAKIAVGIEPTPVQQRYYSQASANYLQAVGAAHQRYSDFVYAASTAVYGAPTAAPESMLSAAQEQYASATLAAAAWLEDLYKTAKSAVGAETTAPNMLDAAYSRYESGISAANSALAAASSSANIAFYGTSTGVIESLASKVSADAQSIASVASGSIIGTETPWRESVVQQAKTNWEELVARASDQVYGTPTAWYEAAWSSAGTYGVYATEGAAAQYSSVQALVSELVVGREPDFTESVYNRLSSAYVTGFGIPDLASSASSVASGVYASASSIASDTYESASSVAGDAYESASSAITETFSSPPTLEAVLDSASNQVNGLVSAASVQIYGTEKNTYEKATSAAASAASSASKQASEAIYGTQTNYLEAAQSSLASQLSAAQAAVSTAYWGDKPHNYLDNLAVTAHQKYEYLLSAAQAGATAAGSDASIAYDAMVKSVSSAVYGPELGSYQSATNRVKDVFAVASKSLESLAGATTKGSIEQATEAISSSASSAASKASKMVKDEL